MNINLPIFSPLYFWCFVNKLSTECNLTFFQAGLLKKSGYFVKARGIITRPTLLCNRYFDQRRQKTDFLLTPGGIVL